MGFFFEVGMDTSKSFEYKRKQLSICREVGDTEEVVQLLMNFGQTNRYLGNLSKALSFYEQALSLSRTAKYKKGVASILEQIAGMYGDQGDTAQALENYKKGIQLSLEIKDTSSITKGYYLIGMLYGKFHEVGKSLECFNKTILLDSITRNKFGMCETYRLMGKMYETNNYLANALVVYQKSLMMHRAIGQDYYVSMLINNIGNIYLLRGDTVKAIEFHSRSLEMAEKFKAQNGNMDNYNIAEACEALAQIYLKRKNFRKAREYSDRNLAMKKRWIRTKDWMDAELLASQIDSATGNGNGAYGHLKQYMFLTDKLNGEEIRKAAAKDKFENDYQRQKDKDKYEQEKKDAITEADKKKQSLVTFYSLVGLVLVLIFAGFVFRSLRITRKQKQVIEAKSKETEFQKQVIEEKQHEITDSINYAKRIQDSILPPRELVQSAFSESFILFRPKDIVSGDFYWFYESTGAYFLAVADCTGHGVPGAFMSMIGSEKLTEAVSLSSDVSEILNLVNRGVKKALRQSDKEDSTRDGMDIALCKFTFAPNGKGGSMDYTGANRPLWLVRNGSLEINEIKATKKAIGGLTEDSQEFVKHTLELYKGDTIYLSSDGFADQFGLSDKKMMTKRFKQEVVSIQNQGMKEQGRHLEQFYLNWKGGVEQTDDVLVIGIRV